MATGLPGVGTVLEGRKQGRAPGSPPSRTPWKAWEVIPLRPAAEIGRVLSRLGAGPQEGLGLA